MRQNCRCSFATLLHSLILHCHGSRSSCQTVSLIVFYMWPNCNKLYIICRLEIKTLRRQQRIQMLENAENQKEALEKEKQEMLLGKIQSYTMRHLCIGWGWWCWWWTWWWAIQPYTTSWFFRVTNCLGSSHSWILSIHYLKHSSIMKCLWGKAALRCWKLQSKRGMHLKRISRSCCLAAGMEAVRLFSVPQACVKMI